MIRVAGVDGAPGGGWAVVIMEGTDFAIWRVSGLAELFDSLGAFDLVAIDIPIGLLDAYEIGGRACDRLARSTLGRRGSSVFPAPVRPVLAAKSYEEAKTLSRNSAPNGKSITKQTWAILPKISEIDALLRSRPELQDIVREVHPELSFGELVGAPMVHPKKREAGRSERRAALAQFIPQLARLEASGQSQGLETVDILDAAIACWSAQRLASGCGSRVPEVDLFDSTCLKMAIWI